jgi:ABC-type transport system involved in cytochrome bd biosynthesis fused ATPase/permease subunit
MWQALSAVGLDDWVRGLPAGLDSMVGIGGAKLSGGQKQRLSLARMFIADPDVWLLDEPTVHLDHQTAVKVLDSVRAATQMRTLVVAAHDSRDLALCDHVIRVDAVERAERA